MQYSVIQFPIPSLTSCLCVCVCVHMRVRVCVSLSIASSSTKALQMIPNIDNNTRECSPLSSSSSSSSSRLLSLSLQSWTRLSLSWNSFVMQWDKDILLIYQRNSFEVKILYKGISKWHNMVEGLEVGD